MQPHHATVARRRRHRRRTTASLVAVLSAVVAVPALIAAISGSPASEADAAPVPATAARDGTGDALVGPGGDPLDGVAPDTPPVPAQLARVDTATLYLPGAALVVGYHEASSPAALELEPVGRLLANHNTTKFDPPADEPDGGDYLVMASRGRPFSATSAVDVVLRDDEPVLSPVTGRVTDVRGYHLYGSHEDERLEIAPAAAPHLRVVLVHLDGITVAVGEEVRAGETVVAGAARRFSFASQIDRETEPERWPHVHLEVKHESAARPADG